MDVVSRNKTWKNKPADSTSSLPKTSPLHQHMLQAKDPQTDRDGAGTPYCMLYTIIVPLPFINVPDQLSTVGYSWAYA